MIRSRLKNLDPNGSFSLILLGLVGTIGSSALMILPFFVGTYVDYLGFGEDTAGWVSAINMAGIAVMILIASLNTKRWALQKVAGYGLVTMMLFDVLSIYFHSLNTLMLLRFLSGMGGGAAMAAVAAAIARLAHSDKGYGIYIAIQFILPTAAFLEFPSLLPQIGFNGMIVILVVLEALALLVVPILLNYPLPTSDEDDDGENEVFALALILRRPAMLSIVGLCIYGAANGGIWAYAERIGLSAGLSYQGVGDLLAVSNILGILGALLVVWLQDKFGHIRPIAVGIVLQIVAMVILADASSPTEYGVGIVLFQMAWAFTWPYFLSVQADIDPTGTVVVAGAFGNLVGNAAGPAMAAFFVGGGGYASAVWLSAALFVAALVPMLAIKRKSNLPSPSELA